MAQSKKITDIIPIISIVIICFIFFSPFLLNPQILTRKDNDLGRNYMPMAMFIQKSILSNSQIPLWRPEQLMGETFVGNPISSIFYPANILFLVKNIDFILILYLFLHITFAGISTYYLARSFSFNPLASFSAAIFYSLSIKMLLHLSAGHLTMIAAFSYFPMVFLSIKMIQKSPRFKWLVIGAVSLTFTYFTYPTILYYSLIFIAIYWLIQFLNYVKNHNFDIVKITKFQMPFLLVLVIAFLLSAIAFFPHSEFGPLSTRSILKLSNVAFPIWNKERFLESLLFPYIFDNLDQEVILYFGLSPTVLAAAGFFYLSKLQKITIGFFGFISLLFVAGTSTPLFEVCYRFMPLLKYSRVTTRMWFVVILVISLIASLAINRIRDKKIIYLFLLLFLIETILFSYQKIFKIPNLSFDNEILYQTIAQDEDLFRVYCTTHCLNPQLTSKYNIQMLDGENPIAHLDAVNFLEKAGNYRYSRFAVIYPPYQVWQTENPPIPNANLLGLANVKYIASTYQISLGDYLFQGQFKNIFLYKNNKYKPRIHFEDFSGVNIEKYTPNEIFLNFESSASARNLIISENYFPGWYAYIDHRKYEVQKYEPIFRKIIVPSNTDRLELKYQPESFLIGKTLTISMIVALLLYYLHKKKVKRSG